MNGTWSLSSICPTWSKHGFCSYLLEIRDKETGRCRIQDGGVSNIIAG